MRDIFQLRENRTSVITEVIAGITTFLAVSYTLTVTPAILEDAGMPYVAVFVASAVTSALCTMCMAFFANSPFAVAPGMGLNSFFAHSLCVGLGFHWREAMAVVFVSSLIHCLLMATGARRTLIASFPEPLKYATSVGIGLFISFIGMKNAGLVSFTVPPGTYTVNEAGMVLADSSAHPSLISRFSMSHVVTLIGLAMTLYLIGLERRTGDRYAPFLLGIVTATFVGIPLEVTTVDQLRFLDYSAVYEIRHVFAGFFGDPGLLSLAANPERLVTAFAMCLVLTLTDIVDSLATIIGTGRLHENPVFAGTEEELSAPGRLGGKMERCLMVNSFSGMISAVFGTSTSISYIESVTGIAAGGRTGLTAFVVAVLFLLCLPFAGLFSLIPGEALAPALILSGLFLMSLVAKIDWTAQEDAFPAALTILFMAITYSVLNGITAGFISYILLKIAAGKAGQLQAGLVVTTAALVLVAAMQNLLDWL